MIGRLVRNFPNLVVGKPEITVVCEKTVRKWPKASHTNQMMEGG
jgi:hypothetical protein